MPLIAHLLHFGMGDFEAISLRKSTASKGKPNGSAPRVQDSRGTECAAGPRMNRVTVVAMILLGALLCVACGGAQTEPEGPVGHSVSPDAGTGDWADAGK